MFRVDALVVQRDFLPLERLANDGQQRALVFSDGNRLVNPIFEQFALVFGHGHRGDAIFQGTHSHHLGSGIGFCQGIGSATGGSLCHLAEHALFLRLVAG
jgi:hypothetical protein